MSPLNCSVCVALPALLLSTACTPMYCHEHPHAHTEGHEAHVIPHDDLQVYENNGNQLKGISTTAHGAHAYEVWRTSVAVGSKTPLHFHESEEVFIFLQGEGKATVGDKTFTFKAPATVIAPPNVPHQFFNTGDVPTDAIVVVGIGSTIYDREGNEMQLPWRK